MASPLAALVFALAPACSSSSSSSSPPSTDGGADASTATVAAFDLGADLTNPDTYWNFPFPSDLRLTAQGTPEVSGFPDPLMSSIIEGLKTVAALRKGYAQTAVAHFAWSAPMAPRKFTDVIPADKSQPLLLIDVDPKSPERGKLWPVVAHTPESDRYVPDNMLSVAAVPGMLLYPSRTYAFVVMRSLEDASGAELGVPPAFAALQSTTMPAANPQLAAWKVYQPLWLALQKAGIDASLVAVATVFTTGDPVQTLADMSSKIEPKYPVTIENLQVRSGGNQPRNCEIVGTVSMPQFQQGTPLFDTQGTFQYGSDGLPTKQRDETVPIAISLPQTAMPASGYPLIVYVHGSGGLSTQLFDRGKMTPAQPNGTPHQGPAYVVAPFGFAMAGAAMPVNPERVPGAPELAYINFNNLAAFPFVFQQGAIEQRLFIDALSKLTISPSVVTSCTGMSLPAGATSYKLDITRLEMQGQSMGGQYANMISAIEPRIGAVAPSGAGGMWSYVVITTDALPGAAGKVGLLLGTTKPLTFLHPALDLLQTGWEPADAFVYTRRIARLPLPGHPARDIYEPTGGPGDEYFATPIYDAMALAYSNKEAGDVVWPTMQTSLGLAGLDGILPYPVTKDLMSDDGRTYTAAVVQYAGDGYANPHYIFQQLDQVKYQYGCFFATFLKNGRATIPAPAALGTPCPGM